MSLTAQAKLLRVLQEKKIKRLKRLGGKDNIEVDLRVVADHPSLENITSTDFGVIEHPTRITRGLIIEDYLEGKSN